MLLPLAEKSGLTLTACYGGAGMDAQIRALAEGTDVLVATPGRLIDLRQRGDVDLSQIEVLVLDEADRMADMGFMPQVEWLLRHLIRAHQTMLFSATLDGDVDRLVRDYLRDPVRHEVVSAQPTVIAMAHRFLLVHQMDKVKVAAAICRHAQRALVFSRTKRGADRLTEALRKEGVDARAIHGDLRQQQRERALRSFAQGRLPVLVATDVAARGIDVDGIDVVIHFDPPEDHKGYLHRSGRTARAGRDGLVVTLVLWNEQLEVERIQRRLGLSGPVVEMFSNDPRLRNLVAWDPAARIGGLTTPVRSSPRAGRTRHAGIRRRAGPRRRDPALGGSGDYPAREASRAASPRVRPMRSGPFSGCASADPRPTNAAIASWPCWGRSPCWPCWRRG